MGMKLIVWIALDMDRSARHAYGPSREQAVYSGSELDSGGTYL